MHDIHDIKSICNKKAFISKKLSKMGYSKYKILSYKPTH
jgi:hypothetical protein